MQAKDMMARFMGMKEAHGIYTLLDDVDSNGKRKGHAVTKRDPVTEQLWKDHLNGKKNLGIIPINADNVCIWGAIDIDEYNLDIQSFAIKVYKQKLPLVPFRSKSGGCHLVIFLSEPVAAKKLQQKLSEIAASLGYGKSEIFPKQSKVLVEKGDLGNWLNMPYYGGDSGTRYALDKKGEAITLSEMLKLASKLELSEAELDKLTVEDHSDALKDGPPCLQSLIRQGFPQGTRNNGLFVLGVYCRKAYPDDWENKLEEMNTNYMDPPLESKEVQIIIRQLNKKDYNYKCNDQPISGFCNAGVCRTRKFGIGGGAMPSMMSLRKIPTDQPVWFLEINGTTIELSTDELQIQSKFQKCCMNSLNIMPPRISDRQWQSSIQTLLDNCIDLEKPKEASLTEQFEEHLYTFCMDSKQQSRSQEDLLLGRPWMGSDPKNPELLRVYFRLADLEEYLQRKNFKAFTRSQIVARLSSKAIDAQSKFFKVKGRGVNTWHIPVPEEQTEPFNLPDMGENVL